ncbi:MAG: hypothetical protein JW902_20025 [Syntrophaceae bacterium]|nr:hypothetical protein [Syntrophaceae bacterium]
MAKRDKNTFAKRQKEIERKQKADEKMARRQNKKKGERPTEGDTLATD